MKPVRFEYSNKVLQPPIDEKYSKDVTSMEPLPIWTDNEQCISCWKMSLKERLSALLFGCVWLAVLSGGTQPPIYAQVSRGYLQEK